MRKLILFMGLFLALCACQSELRPDAYMAWMSKHQDERACRIQKGNLQTTLYYVPSDWLAINEAGINQPNRIAQTQKEYAGLEYYRLRIALTDGQGDILQYGAKSTDDYYQRVEYFSFGLQKDLKLLIGTDTLPCKLFHFERNYGSAPYADFMLGFDEHTGLVMDRILLYEDIVFMQSLIQLTIPFENIQSIPKLKI